MSGSDPLHARSHAEDKTWRPLGPRRRSRKTAAKAPRASTKKRHPGLVRKAQPHAKLRTARLA
eukprot:4025925-Alexandrium_andersonii.AAC.1